MCGQGSQAAVAWLNENGPSVHMVEAANMCGSKETEKQQASPNCEKKEKKLVRNVLWSESRSLWVGLGGQRLPGRQGQP